MILKKTIELINSKPKYNLFQLTGEYEVRDINGGRITYVECECECGDINWYKLSGIKNGKSKKCKRHSTNMSIGKTFNEITVLSISHYDSHRNAYANCECSCGYKGKYDISALKCGKIKQCKTHVTNICIGNTYNEIKVMSFSHYDKDRSPMVNCECSCGYNGVFSLARLKSGHTTKCKRHSSMLYTKMS